MVAEMQVPTLDEITKKEQTIKEALNYKFNDKDIEDVSLFLRMLIDFFVASCIMLQNRTFFLSSLTADCEREGQIPKSTSQLCHEENAVAQRQGEEKQLFHYHLE